MRTLKSRVLSTTAIVCALALAFPSAAQAVTRSGSIGCSNNGTGVTTGVSTGNSKYVAPGGSNTFLFKNGDTYTHRELSATRAGGGAWSISSSGKIASAGAYCLSGRP